MQKYFDEIVGSISKIVQFDSSLAPAVADMPFGKGAKDALDWFLHLASSFGFETKNYDNYVGEVVFGEGEELGILAHLDVVPAGDGWTHNPFGGEVSLDRIWGRGTTDDKGPAVICLYCLKALKDEGYVPRKKIKLIVGCNEESGWKCMKHYKEVAHMPEIGFSPDANFPVIYAEKGILHFAIHFPVKNPPFSSMKGGSAANAVCALCKAVDLEGNELVFRGKAAHASTPEAGDNAIFKALSRYAPANEDIQKVIDCLFADKFGLKSLQDETGHLTLSPDLVCFENGNLSFVVDIRYPATHTLQEVTTLLDKFGAPYEILSHQAPLFNDRNSPLISTLTRLYSEAIGRDVPPMAIGGGTYARALPLGAGFGPEMEGEDCHIHDADEFISFKTIRFCADLYYQTIKELSK